MKPWWFNGHDRTGAFLEGIITECICNGVFSLLIAKMKGLMGSL
jgi:hypothetical protein